MGLLQSSAYKFQPSVISGKKNLQVSRLICTLLRNKHVLPLPEVTKPQSCHATAENHNGEKSLFILTCHNE